ncbi:MAG: hypothetical protein ACTSSJ_03095 [Candidatus Odinarchaeia archaeon]
MELNEQFNTYIELIKRKFKLKITAEPPKISVSNTLDVNRNSRNFGVWYDNNVMYISKKYLRSELLDAILIREASRLFLPETLRKIDAASDICMFIAYKLCKNKEAWLKKWESVAPPIFVKDIRYWPTHDFFNSDKASGGSFVKDFINFLSKLELYKKELTEEEYLYLFDYFQGEIFTPLSETDIKVILTLRKNTKLGVKELSAKLGLKEQYLRVLLWKLKNRVWLRLQGFIVWPKIGLEHVVVLFKPVSGELKKSITEILRPYIRKIHILGGSQGNTVLAIYTLPFGTSRSLYSLFKKLKSSNIIEWFYVLNSKELSSALSFDHYNVENRRWEINWDSFLEEFYNVQRNNNINLFNLKYSPIKLPISREDLRLLQLIHSNEGIKRKWSEFSEYTGLPKKVIKNKLQQLELNGVYKLEWVLYPQLIGLKDQVFTFFNVKDESMIERIRNWISTLPVTYTLKVTGDIEGLIAINALPRESLSDFFRTILKFGTINRHLITDLKMYIEHQQSMVSRLIPIMLYSGGEWLKPDEAWDVFKD